MIEELGILFSSWNVKTVITMLRRIARALSSIASALPPDPFRLLGAGISGNAQASERLSRSLELINAPMSAKFRRTS